MNKIIPIRSGCIITNQTITHSTLDEMLYCSLIWGLTSSIWKWKKVSSWDTRKVKVSKDIKTNKILDSDEKEKWDLTISWITNAREFCSSRPFTPCILSMAAYSSDLKLQWLPSSSQRIQSQTQECNLRGLITTRNYFCSTTRSRNPQPSIQQASSCLTLELSILKVGVKRWQVCS